MLLIVRARILRSQGYLAQARRLLDGLAADARATPRWVRQRIDLETADMRLALGDSAAAVKILATVADDASSRTDAVCTHAALLDGRPAAGDAGARFDLDVAPRIRVVAWLAQASAHLDTGDDRSASSAIQQALQIAGPERLRRPFIESAPRVRTLIRHGLSEAAMTGWLDPTRPTSERVVPGDTAQLAPAVALTLIRGAVHARNRGSPLSRRNAVHRGDRRGHVHLREYGSHPRPKHLAQARRAPTQ